MAEEKTETSFQSKMALDKWGFTTFKDDEGVQAASNYREALEVCGDDKIDPEQRIQVAKGMKTWLALAPVKVTEQPLMETIPLMFSIVEKILLSPNDDPGIKIAEEAAAAQKAEEEEHAAAQAAAEAAGKKYRKKMKVLKEKKIDYVKQGLQIIAVELLAGLNSYSSKHKPYGSAAFISALKCLENVNKTEYIKRTPIKKYEHEPCYARYLSITSLFGVSPPLTGQDFILDVKQIPSNIIEINKLYANSDFYVNASRLITMVEKSQGDSGYFIDKLDDLFDIIKLNNKIDFFTTFNTIIKKKYELDVVRLSFEKNIDVLIGLEYSRVMQIFDVMSSNEKTCELLVSYIERFIQIIEKNEAKLVEATIFKVLASIAKSQPNAIFPHVDHIYTLSMNTTGSGFHLCSLLSNCGQANIEPNNENNVNPATIKVVGLLCKLLYEPTMENTTIPSILMSISNQFVNLNEYTSILDNDIEKIKSYHATSNIIVEKIVDWYEGRSLKKTDERIDALEAKINAMNDEFASACHNMEEVSALMDSKIADLKDFVGEIVKKLPQPCQLEVIGGLRKTLVLHFRCARSGQTVTTETKDWNQWCKVGFGLIKLGKCAAVAAAGNPMALTSGVGAIQDIYNGYKAKDDKDFNTFISQPFLTSEESDKLINQLRAGKFFEKMEYDAQSGDWVCIGTLSETEVQKRQETKAALQETKSNVTQTKGANFGLGKMDMGGVKDLLSTASDVSSIVNDSSTATGNSEGNELSASFNENLALAPDVMAAASLAKQVTAKPPPKAKPQPPPKQQATLPTPPPSSPADQKSPEIVSPMRAPETTTTTTTTTSPMGASASTPSKPKKRGSMFGFFGGGGSNKNDAAQEAIQKATEDAWVVKAANDSNKIKELEARIAFLEAEQTRVKVLEEQVAKLIAGGTK